MKSVKQILSTTQLKVDKKECLEFYKKARSYYRNVDLAEELGSINKKLITQMFDMVDIKEREVDLLVPETTLDIKENYNKEFIDGILKVFKKYNYRIHATSSAEKIMKEGLLVRDDNKEINYTSFCLNDKTDNEILFTLFNDMHKGQKQIIVLDAQDEDLVEYKDKYKVPTERIKCYIDIENQTVTYNPMFKSLNRDGERNCDRENQEILGNDKFQIDTIESQIRVFEQLNKTDSINEIENTNTRIYEYLMSLIQQIDNTIAVTNEEKEKLIYYVSQVDNDNFKALKLIKENEKKLGESLSKSVKPLDSSLSLDNTGDYF